MDDSRALASYGNFCGITGTPEEVILDIGMNPQPIGLPAEPISIGERVITNYINAKRPVLALQSAIRRHEADHGPLEIDIQKRVKLG